MHEGSWDRKHLNNDSLVVKPAETITIFAHEGAGVVRRFWITTNPERDVDILSRVVLRMYWDGDEYPSVEAPIGAFFGVGFGEQRDYISLPLNETSGGYDCYWPMPFHKSARWTLTNGSGKPLQSFYYNIDYTAFDSLPKDTRHFHAQFRRENPTTPEKDYVILDTVGAGHYVGTALFMAGWSLGFLEGNERVYVDGETTPSIEGTGTEDYFSSGYYFDHGLYSSPYHGVVIKEEHPARVSAYRWHIEDAIPFTKSIRFTIEHGTGSTETADYSSVAYYYLAGPSPAPTPLPLDLLPSPAPIPMVIPNAIGAGTLKYGAQVTSGEVSVWDIDPKIWSRGEILVWFPKDKNAEMTLNLSSAKNGEFEVIVRAVTGRDLGTVQFEFEGKPVGRTVDLYAPVSEYQPKEISLGFFKLKAGTNPIVVKAVGTDPDHMGIAINAIVLKPSPEH
jgi:hypothetical protein